VREWKKFLLRERSIFVSEFYGKGMPGRGRESESWRVGGSGNDGFVERGSWRVRE
jgi:hypothetical protein